MDLEFLGLWSGISIFLPFVVVVVIGLFCFCSCSCFFFFSGSFSPFSSVFQMHLLHPIAR
jgi:hypothetical protein